MRGESARRTSLWSIRQSSRDCEMIVKATRCRLMGFSREPHAPSRPGPANQNSIPRSRRERTRAECTSGIFVRAGSDCAAPNDAVIALDGPRSRVIPSIFFPRLCLPLFHGPLGPPPLTFKAGQISDRNPSSARKIRSRVPPPSTDPPRHRFVSRESGLVAFHRPVSVR